MKIVRGKMIMKASIDKDNCIYCGQCARICPEVFRMAEDDYAEVYIDKVPFEAESTVLAAQENCPVLVIKVK
jgi:ferredoxin